jgi:hypothetical protein
VTESAIAADNALLADPTVKRVCDWLCARFPDHRVGARRIFNSNPGLRSDPVAVCGGF